MQHRLALMKFLWVIYVAAAATAPVYHIAKYTDCISAAYHNGMQDGSPLSHDEIK